MREQLPSWVADWWRPKETAPRTGEDFIAIMGNGVISVARYVTPGAFAADHLGSGNTELANWMPMIPPPRRTSESR